MLEKTDQPQCRGRVVAVSGTVLEVDVEGTIPPLSAALRCQLAAGHWITAVVHAHMSGTRVRAIALESTRCLKRGAAVESDGAVLTVPVGRELLGRVVDLHGRPLDG